MRRFTLASLLVLVAVLAVGLAAMRAGTKVILLTLNTATFLLLLVATLAALVRRRRGAWAGFALFGWSGGLVIFVPSAHEMAEAKLPPIVTWVEAVMDWMHPLPLLPAAPPISANAGGPNVTIRRPERSITVPAGDQEAWTTYLDRLAAVEAQADRREQAQEIGETLLILLFGIVGALLGRALSDRGESAPTAESSPSDHVPHASPAALVRPNARG